MTFLKITFFSETMGDAAEFWQIGLQDPATPVMESILFFHNTLMIYLLGVGVFVSWFLFLIVRNFNLEANPKPELFSHNSTLEIGWTVAPAMVLICISIPSFALLYSLDELIKPTLTLKVVGHQWFWSYEYDNSYRFIGFNCLLFPTDSDSGEELIFDFQEESVTEETLTQEESVTEETLTQNESVTEEALTQEESVTEEAVTQEEDL